MCRILRLRVEEVAQSNSVTSWTASGTPKERTRPAVERTIDMPVLTSPKTYECATCRAALKSQRDLDNHMCLLHDDCGEARLGSPITFRCATCGEAFARRSDLYAHLRDRGHGNPSEWDKARPPGEKRLRGRPRRASG